MNILYLTSELPYPLRTGFMRHYYFLRSLGPRHEVTYVSLTRRKEGADEETLRVLSALAKRVVVFPVSDAGRISTALERIGSLPVIGGTLVRGTYNRHALGVLRRYLAELQQHERFDLALIGGKMLHPIADALQGTPIMMDCCDAVHVRVGQELRYATPLLAPFYALRYLRIRRLEKQIVARFPNVTFVSERDRRSLMNNGGGAVVPQGVDLGYWRRSQPYDGTPRIVFSGVMSYPPNHDAAMQLVQRIVPALRERLAGFEVKIVGRDPRRSLLNAARACPEVEVTGEVEDVRPYLENATVFVAPLRFASGMQNKILEAMAMELPVVTTPVAADGLNSNGASAPLRIAVDANEIADEIAALAKDRPRRQWLASAGRAFVESHHSWPLALERFEQEYLRAAMQGKGKH